MGLVIAIGLAGALGSVARYLVDGAVQDRTSGLFPFGTTTVNVIGSALLGLVTGVTMRKLGPTGLDAIVGSGFCGGLTTWSTASWETIRLLEERAPSVAVRYVLVSLGVSVLAGGVGLALGLV